MFSRSFSFTVKLCALLVLIAAGALLAGPAGFGPGEQRAEATLLNDVKKLLASDAQFDDSFGWSVAFSGDTAVVGSYRESAGAPGPARPTSSGATRAARTTGAR